MPNAMKSFTDAKQVPTWMLYKALLIITADSQLAQTHHIGGAIKGWVIPMHLQLSAGLLAHQCPYTAGVCMLVKCLSVNALPSHMGRSVLVSLRNCSMERRSESSTVSTDGW
jgi:hypothetical protein